MKFHLLLLALSTPILLSCAHVSEPRNSNFNKFTSEQLEEINRDALTLASAKLATMVTEAKTNEATKKFLSTDLFLKGNMSLLEGDYLTASVLFGHLANLVPEDDFVLKKHAVSLIRVGDLEKSRLVLEQLFNRSRDEKVGLILAGVYTGLDQESEARIVYETLLKLNPKNEDACVFLGKSHAIAKATDKAIALLNNCSRQDPKNGMYDYYVGKIHLDNNQMKLAVASFEKSYQRQPTLSQAVNALGVIYEDAENYEKAVSLYRKHLEKSPADASILARVVHVLFLKERFDEVIPYAETLSDLEPENLNLKVKLGILYTDSKKFAEAVSIFKDLLVTAPQSDKILYYLGAIYQEMKEWQESIEFFNQIPASSGLYSDSSIQMANMLSSLAQDEHHAKQGQKWKDAFAKLVNTKLAELKDLKVEFSVIKAGFYEATGQNKEAMDALLVVQDEKGFSVQHKYYLANLFEKEKRFADATNLIMGVLEKEPKNAHAWNFLGYSLLVRGEEMDLAFKYIQKAKAISPDDGYIRDSLGWYYYKKGDIKRALTELQVAFSKVPDDVEILKHLAIIHQELKDYSKAKNFLESALKHARYQFDRQEILGQIQALENSRIPASSDID